MVQHLRRPHGVGAGHGEGNTLRGAGDQREASGKHGPHGVGRLAGDDGRAGCAGQCRSETAGPAPRSMIRPPGPGRKGTAAAIQAAMSAGRRLRPRK